MPPHVEFAGKPVAIPDVDMSYGELLRNVCDDFFEAIPEGERAEAEAKILSGRFTWFTDSVPYWPVSKAAKETPAKEPPVGRDKRTRSSAPAPRKTRQPAKAAKTKPGKAKATKA